METVTEMEIIQPQPKPVEEPKAIYFISMSEGTEPIEAIKGAMRETQKHHATMEINVITTTDESDNVTVDFCEQNNFNCRRISKEETAHFQVTTGQKDFSGVILGKGRYTESEFKLLIKRHENAYQYHKFELV